MKDSKYEDLNKTLAAVGKTVFVNFYYDFFGRSVADYTFLRFKQ